MDSCGCILGVGSGGVAGEGGERRALGSGEPFGDGGVGSENECIPQFIDLS